MGGHPKGLTTLFLHRVLGAIQLLRNAGDPHAVHGCQREQRGDSDSNVATAAARSNGFYTAAVFFMGIPGGWIADRLLGQRNAVLYGGILIAMGHYSLAIDSQADLLRRAGVDRARTGLLQTKHQCD